MNSNKKNNPTKPEISKKFPIETPPSTKIVKYRAAVHESSQSRRPPLPNKAMAFFDPDGDLFMHIAMNAYDEHLRELVPCSRCGRKFFPDRIAKHEPNCNADKVIPAVKHSAIPRSLPFHEKSHLHSSNTLAHSTSKKICDKITPEESLNT